MKKLLILATALSFGFSGSAFAAPAKKLTPELAVWVQTWMSGNKSCGTKGLLSKLETKSQITLDDKKDVMSTCWATKWTPTNVKCGKKVWMAVSRNGSTPFTGTQSRPGIDKCNKMSKG